MMYRGSKDQIQNAGAVNQFTYRPNFYRVGAFGNYLFFDKLDLLGGYEVDYYIKTGTAIMARLDRSSQTINPQPTMHTRAWGIGAEHALTDRGNVVLRASYNQEHDGDPVALVGSTDKLFKLERDGEWLF